MGKLSKNSKKRNLDKAQDKTTQTRSGSKDQKEAEQAHAMPASTGKRRRTEDSAAISAPQTPAVEEAISSPNTENPAIDENKSANLVGVSDTKTNHIATTTKDSTYEHDPKSKSSLMQDPLTGNQTPSLRARRRNNEPSVPRRKLSKRKPEGQACEGQRLARSAPVPIPQRPVSYAEGPLRRDTQKGHTRLSKHGDQEHSAVSLPIPESLHDIGPTSDQSSFTINVLGVLGPRPTIRYKTNPRYGSPLTPAMPTTFDRQRNKEDEDLSSKKRIDDLANGLDAHALRELLERDQRRRERRRKIDRGELERKLKRRAEYQAQAGPSLQTPSPEGDEIVADAQSDSPPARHPPKHEAQGSHPEPNHGPHTGETEPLVAPTLRPRSSVYTRTSQASFSAPTSSAQQTIESASNSCLPTYAREATPDLAHPSEPGKRQSEHNSGQLSSWTSFFRRGSGRPKSIPFERNKPAPEDSSSTSRDSVSMSTKYPPGSMVRAPRTFRKSSAPQRTRSKFKEDLPELPLSPPDSRVQSPRMGAAPVEGSVEPDHEPSVGDPSRLLANNPRRTVPENKSQEDTLEESRTTEPATPSVAALSQSLASVDSEGSWLSGKPAKRSSTHRDLQRQSQSSLQAHLSGPGLDEGSQVANDPYFSRLSPGSEKQQRSSTKSALRKASSTVLNIDAGSLIENEMPVSSTAPIKNVERWHSGIGRQPTLIRPKAQARSKEGLLKEYRARDAETGMVVDAESDAESPDLEDKELQASASPVLRAQSVNYGPGHARRISAGSAKLLDICGSSADSKRLSLPRGERNSNPIPGPPPREE